MTEAAKPSVADLQKQLIALAAEIEAQLAAELTDDTVTFEALPEQTARYVQILESLFSELADHPIEGELRLFLEEAHQSIQRWTQKAIEVRDETRHTLLNLAQGRKAKGHY